MCLKSSSVCHFKCSNQYQAGLHYVIVQGVFFTQPISLSGDLPGIVKSKHDHANLKEKFQPLR